MTRINVFTVESDQQHALIDYLSRVAQIAGEVPARMSTGLDGTRVVNYAQSEDLDAAQRVIQHLKAEGLLDGNKAFGQAHPGLYEVSFTLDRDDS